MIGKTLKIFEVAEESLLLARRIESWSPHAAADQKALCVALFIKIRNDFLATLTLLRAGMNRQAQAMARIELEAFGLLCWLVTEWDEAIRKLSRSHFRDSRIALQGLRSHQMLGAEDHSEAGQTIEVIRDYGERLGKIEQIFEKLGLKKMYDTMYRWGSVAVHTALPAIDDRIIRGDPNSIEGFRFGQDAEVDPTALGLATDVFLRSLLALSTLLDVGLEQQIGELLLRLERA